MSARLKVVVLCLVCSSCSPDEQVECDELIRIIGAGEDRGFHGSADELLGRLDLPFEGRLQYENDGTGGLPGAVSDVLMTLNYAAGEVRIIDRTPKDDASRGQCKDVLEIDVAADFVSTDGHLDWQQVDAVLTVRQNVFNPSSPIQPDSEFDTYVSIRRSLTDEERRPPGLSGATTELGLHWRVELGDEGPAVAGQGTLSEHWWVGEDEVGRAIGSITPDP